ncbi:pilus assembly protein [Burkholderia stagnalis]|uniref:Molecular chaperone n=1 Tax=Burkholderia stagnalis TaxID=1503054 RepID=A0A108M1B6_9BURK|nr:molecular chaperone [Burkholderia stagnalis]KVC68708.1 pilus assembly protein [Burkholderia stagnalis]KVD85272.1 pilus assembly protein [Burkholderia stagnalis]KVN05785.1 pilus assembly protein [Burkholderia stagnalis]KVN25307.1 pilus assembly protein [Burkholderia stagnalis]KVN67600.1 pilus assembly protein [Burkholderia stagnalis]
MNWKLPKATAAFALLATLWMGSAQASVVITGTRVIFPGDSREVTVRLMNDGDAPALVQAWIDTGNEKEAPEKISVPFVLTPAMFRLEAGKGQSLRLIQTQESLPADRESLFWLNVLEIPPKASAGDSANKVQLAFRSRIKVMYRPSGLAGHPEAAADQLKWTFARQADGNGYALKASNPSPYVVNLGVIDINVNGKKHELKPSFVRPGETAEFPLPAGVAAPASAVVDYGYIDDWGTIKPTKQITVGGAAHD